MERERERAKERERARERIEFVASLLTCGARGKGGGGMRARGVGWARLGDAGGIEEVEARQRRAEQVRRARERRVGEGPAHVVQVRLPAARAACVTVQLPGSLVQPHRVRPSPVTRSSGPSPSPGSSPTPCPTPRGPRLTPERGKSTLPCPPPSPPAHVARRRAAGPGPGLHESRRRGDVAILPPRTPCPAQAPPRLPPAGGRGRWGPAGGSAWRLPAV